MAVGHKIVGSRRTKAIALRVYVERKEADVPAARRIPPLLHVHHPTTGIAYRVPSDVVECPPARHQSVDPTARVRPVPGGVSGSIRAASDGAAETGTLGGWAWDRRHATPVMLSNEHVLGHKPRSHILQPGLGDSIGVAPERVGVVRRGIARVSGRPVTCDCAIGTLDAADGADFTVPRIGPAIMAVAEPRLGQPVEKFGRSTRHTVGVIDAMHWHGIVRSSLPDAPTHLYRDAIQIRPVPASRPWGEGGDSGALVFLREGAADGSGIKPVVGLHFGGDAAYGLACRISHVFRRLGLETLLGGAQRALSEAMLRRRATDAPITVTQRKAEASRVDAIEATLRRFVAILDVSPRDRAIVRTVARHRAELAALLIKEPALLRATALALRPLAGGDRSVGALLARPVTPEVRDGLRAAVRALRARATRPLRRALARVDAMLRSRRARTLGQLIGVTADQVRYSPEAPTSSARAATASSRRSAARSASAVRGRSPGSAAKARRKKARTPSGASGT